MKKPIVFDLDAWVPLAFVFLIDIGLIGSIAMLLLILCGWLDGQS